MSIVDGLAEGALWFSGDWYDETSKKGEWQSRARGKEEKKLDTFAKDVKHNFTHEQQGVWTKTAKVVGVGCGALLLVDGVKRMVNKPLSKEDDTNGQQIKNQNHVLLGALETTAAVALVLKCGRGFVLER